MNSLEEFNYFNSSLVVQGQDLSHDNVAARFQRKKRLQRQSFTAETQHDVMKRHLTIDFER